ncbi:MAG: ribonuclease HII [Longimicrobiales bacterium]
MASESKDTRPPDLLSYERRFWGRGFVAGLDEAGRGPLAGPVVAGAVCLDPGTCIDGAADSKILDLEDRERLALEIHRGARAVGLGAASVREIERLNILRATALAMRRALAALEVHVGHVVVDGLPVRSLGWCHEAVVKGDGRIHSVSCASIVAKVCRDRVMRRLAARYPGYGWETNVGYPTAEHREALRRLGPTPHHRRTFGGVQTELDL